MVASPLSISFPLPRVHTGFHLGNGRMGALVWGQDQVHITFCHAGFWDRRGRRDEASPLTFAQIRRLLLSGKEDQVREAFAASEGPIQQLGGGRLTLDFGSPPVQGVLDPQSGLLKITLASGAQIMILHAMDQNLLLVRSEEESQARMEPAWTWAGRQMENEGLPGPCFWNDGAARGFTQETPEDEVLHACWMAQGSVTALSVHLGPLGRESAFLAVSQADWDSVLLSSRADWGDFWSSLPDLAYPDSMVQEALEYGLWKLHIVCHPDGIPATLQGCWMEDHRIPLWSNDYHFNINLQMMYGACQDLGLSSHLAPLWKMLRGWLPKLRDYGESFFEAPGAVMLPHAVDDKGHPIGRFWQGTIDHVSTAWVALMAWKEAERTGDLDLLHGLAWPLMEGAFAGFAAMLDEDGAGSLRLPISVSPEWGEGALGTWGANSSFALAAIHRLCWELPKAAALAGKSEDPAWEEVSRRLPDCALALTPRGPYDSPHDPARLQVCLWEGQDLTHSHRHHSHLAGLYPFGVFEGSDRPEVAQALLHWTKVGGGQWCAWGGMWAVCLLARAGWTDAAECWLRFLVQSCRNEGKSLSAAPARGVMEGWGSAEQARLHRHEGDHEVMQLDANLGVITAALEVARARVREGKPSPWPQSAPLSLLESLGLGTAGPLERIIEPVQS